MRGELRTRLLIPLAAALLLAVLVPAAAQAESHTYLNTDDLYASEDGGLVGPAIEYQSSIVVSGLSGTVTRVAVTLIELDSSSPDDIDMVLTGPNGQQVMLMSDACGEYPNNLEDEDWTFEDAAPTYIPNGGPCPPLQQASFKPSNYLGAAPEPDDLSPGGGPAPPYVNALSFFNGSSPDGDWNLYVLDDNSLGYVGFQIRAWALTLDVEPPPPAPAPAPVAAPAAVQPSRTGKRAAALSKCKKRKTRRARVRCRRKAKALPA
jgi:subtilisin-like proprotein convertase family protein